MCGFLVQKDSRRRQDRVGQDARVFAGRFVKLREDEEAQAVPMAGLV